MRPDQALAVLSRAGTGPAPQNQVVFARVVIIFGTGETGLFQYQGTPGPGNPPILWAVPPGVTGDPYGNPLPVSGGIASEAAGGGLLSQLFAGSLIFGDTLSPDPLTYGGLLRLIHMAASGDTPIIALDSPAADAAETHASFWLIGAPSGGTTLVQAALFGLTHAGAAVSCEFIMCGPMPFGTISGGLPVAETWHDLPPTLAGWAQTGGGTDPLQYRLVASPPNSVQITGNITGGALPAGASTIATIPAAYRPPANPTQGMTGVLTFGRGVINDPPNLVVTTAGLLQVRNVTGATQLQVNVLYSLDTNPV